MKAGLSILFRDGYKYSLLGIAIASSFLLFACGTQGPSISEAPENAQQESDADSTDANAENQQENDLEPSREELEQLYKEELEERYQGRANGITTYYHNAQRFFYMRNYQAALYHIRKAAEIHETSDILALRGSIYLALGSFERFMDDWTKALEMDENVPIPNVDFVINALKAQGLINQNKNPTGN